MIDQTAEWQHNCNYYETEPQQWQPDYTLYTTPSWSFITDLLKNEKLALELTKIWAESQKTEPTLAHIKKAYRWFLEMEDV